MLICALTLAWGLAACGGSSSGTVSATRYAKAFCEAVRPFETDLSGLSSAFSRDAGGTPARQKAALEKFLGALAGDVRTAVGKLKAAGTPDVSKGAAVASSITDAFSRVGVELSSASQQARSLPTTSLTTLTTAADRLLAGVQTALAGIGSSSTARSPALEAAARKVSVCQAS